MEENLKETRERDDEGTKSPGAPASNVQPIEALKPRHVAIIDFIVAHPWMLLGDVALAHNCSPAWLATLMRSDLFKARLKERQDLVFQDHVTTMGDRIEALATRSLERLLEKMDTEPDTAKINKTAELALRACGFIKDRPQVGTTNNTVVVGSVDKNTLEAARLLSRNRFTPQSVPQLIEHEQVQAAAG